MKPHEVNRQRSHREAATHQRSIYSPPYNFARETIEDHRQVDKLVFQANVGDVCDPELVEPRQRHATC
jgi:hypothetical protein